METLDSLCTLRIESRNELQSIETPFGRRRSFFKTDCSNCA
jgi:hypothetical protein